MSGLKIEYPHADELQAAVRPQIESLERATRGEQLRCIMKDAASHQSADELRATISQLQAEIARYREALTPSATTKAAYIGEFHFNIEDRDEDGEECLRSITVPWTTVKDIMKAIAARATLGGSNDH